jgi:hypothetical protein
MPWELVPADLRYTWKRPSTVGVDGLPDEMW